MGVQDDGRPRKGIKKIKLFKKDCVRAQLIFCFEILVRVKQLLMLLQVLSM